MHWKLGAFARFLSELMQGNHKIIRSCTIKILGANHICHLFGYVVSPKFHVNNKSRAIAKSSDNLMAQATPIFKTKSIVIINFTIFLFKSLAFRVVHQPRRPNPPARPNPTWRHTGGFECPNGSSAVMFILKIDFAGQFRVP